MKQSRKSILFFFILIAFVLATVETGTRAIYFIKYGRISHLIPRHEVDIIRKVLPYIKNDKQKALEKGDYLIKNGYYIVNPNANIYPHLGLKINSLGFRGKEIAGDKDCVTIWCLGGSSTFGYECKKPYPEILEELLNKNGSRCVVLNGGIPGFNVQHIYNMLRDEKLVEKIHPDIIVINNTWNTLTQYENGFLVESVENGFLRAVINKSVIAFFIYKASLKIKYGETLGPFQAMCVYLDKICRWAAEKKITLFIVNEPMILSDKAWQAAPENPKNYNHAALIFKMFEEQYKGNVFFVPIAFFNEMDYGNENEVKKYFIDKGHLTEAGCAVEAEALSMAIQKTCHNPLKSNL